MSTPALPIGTLVEQPASLGKPRPPLMKRMCARCELVLGWVVCSSDQAGQITHTSCQTCFEREMTALADYLANRAAHALADEYSLDVTPRRNGAQNL
jgi:hypothetical protein